MRVYIVDDEQIIAETLALILERKGFSVAWFTNPLEVLSMVELSPPDLLISDVMMPELCGVELAIRVRSILPRCRILLLSAHFVHFEENPSLFEHGFGLVAKPVHPDVLLVAIRSLPIPSG